MTKMMFDLCLYLDGVGFIERFRFVSVGIKVEKCWGLTLVLVCLNVPTVIGFKIRLDFDFSLYLFSNLGAACASGRVIP